jgi:hypothetical protein
MDFTNYREQRKILEGRLEYLTGEASLLLEHFKIAAREEMEHPEYEPTAQVLFGQPLTYVRNQIEEIKATLETLPPCEAFEKRFSAEAHDLYLEKYPINRKTAVLDWLGHPSSTYAVYSQPVQLSVVWSPAEPGYISVPTLRAPFERWGWRNYVYNSMEYFRFAWCPEINTVYVI